MDYIDMLLYFTYAVVAHGGGGRPNVIIFSRFLFSFRRPFLPCSSTIISSSIEWKKKTIEGLYLPTAQLFDFELSKYIISLSPPVLKIPPNKPDGQVTIGRKRLLGSVPIIACVGGTGV